MLLSFCSYLMFLSARRQTSCYRRFYTSLIQFLTLTNVHSNMDIHLANENVIILFCFGKIEVVKPPIWTIIVPSYVLIWHFHSWHWSDHSYIKIRRIFHCSQFILNLCVLLFLIKYNILYVSTVALWSRCLDFVMFTFILFKIGNICIKLKHNFYIVLLILNLCNYL